MGGAARAALAVASGGVGLLRDGAVLLSPIRARRLRRRPAGDRERPPVEPPHAAARAAPGRLLRHRAAVPAGAADAADEPDLDAVGPERVGAARQDRRP